MPWIPSPAMWAGCAPASAYLNVCDQDGSTLTSPQALKEMTDATVDVVVQIAGEDVPAGRLWAHRDRGVGSATFAYLPEYLARDDSYELDRLLAKHTGQQQTPDGQALFGAFSDAAPDGWGRRLIRRNELHRARDRDVTQRNVAEIDYLLGVRDDLRQGALRFRDPRDGTYLAAHSAGVPHLIDLPRLLGAAEQLERDEASRRRLEDPSGRRQLAWWGPAPRLM